MLKYFIVALILQALVIRQTISWGTQRNQSLFTSPTGQLIPTDTLKQRLQFFQKNYISENQNYNDHFVHGENCQYTNLDAKNVVDSIKAAIQFYHDYSHLAFQRKDSAVGLLTLKGNLLHINKIVDRTMKNFEFSKQLNQLLEKSRNLSTSILEHSSERTARGDSIARGLEKYMKGNNTDIWAGPIGAWKSFDIIPKYQGQFSDIGDEAEVIDDYTSYNCLSKLLTNCDVPSDCQTIYLEKIYSQYMLTHQVLYLNLAEGKSCMAEGENFAKFKDWGKLVEKMCGKVFQEAQFIARNGFPSVFKDLLGKQISFCGMAGYPNFMRIDWMKEILSWQSKGTHGCFTDIYGEVKNTDEMVHITTKNTSGESFEESCLIHFTAVSLSAIATHFRYMFDTCPQDIFKDVLY